MLIVGGGVDSSLLSRVYGAVSAAVSYALFLNRSCGCAETWLIPNRFRLRVYVSRLGKAYHARAEVLDRDGRTVVEVGDLCAGSITALKRGLTIRLIETLQTFEKLDRALP